QAVARVERDGEQRAGLPLEGVTPVLPFLPDLRRSAAFDHEHDLLVEMPLLVERTGRRNLDHVAAPQALGAVELDVAAAPAEPPPWRDRQALHAPHADAAIDRDALGLHEAVVRHLRALECAEAGVLAGLRFVPMDLVRRVVHQKNANVRISMLSRGRACGGEVGSSNAVCALQRARPSFIESNTLNTSASLRSLRARPY